MSDQDSDTTTQNIAQAIQEVSDRASLLVREEIELAKAEVTEKVTKLVKGAVVGIAAGIFAVFGLIYLMHGLAWLAWFELFLLGALAGFIAARAFKSGAPPTPQLAIDEAKLIKETVQSPHPEQTV